MLLASSATAVAQGRDESLRQLFVASDAVVAVEVRKQLIGTTQGELFEYLPEASVVEVFKWDVPSVTKAEGKLDVRIVVEKEHKITDLSKGNQVVLFLEVERLKSGVTFVTVDKWFSVQPFTVGLQTALDRIVADQKANPIQVPASASIEAFHSDPVRAIGKHFKDFVIGLPELKTILTEYKQITRYEWRHNFSHVLGGGDYKSLWDSPADWISLGQATGFDKPGEPYVANPPVAPGGKVSILDTDHLGWKVYVNDATLSRAWVWKSFVRGHNPILMEDLKNNSGWIAARTAMGHTRTYANKMNLAAMTPENGLSTTDYCLASMGGEYLAYQPGSGEFSVNMVAGNYAFEWFDPTKGSVASTGSIKAAGGNQAFTPPFSGAAVLYLKVASAKPGPATGTTPPPRPGNSGENSTIDGLENRTIRVATCQAQGRSIDWRITKVAEVLAAVDKNLDELEKLILKAGEQKCDVLTLPEDTLGLLHWYGINEKLAKQVLPEAVKRMIDRLGQAAAKHRMYLVVCSDQIEADGATYNTAFFLGRDGKEIGRYHKVCPTWAESGARKRGQSFPVFGTPDLGTVGLTICYDLVFPETARCLALQGADIIFFPTMGGAAIGDDDIGLQALRVRAAENRVYLVVAFRGSGSMIISPSGKILAKAEGADGLAIADIDPRGGREGGDSSNQQTDMRARLFRERNPEAFKILTEPNPPVLAKVPLDMTREEAGRIFARMLTVGPEELKQAEALASAGKTKEAIAAFEKLRTEYRGSWIDRAASERLRTLREPPE